MLEAIHWKPAIRWSVEKIHVLKPIYFERTAEAIVLVEPSYVIEGHFCLTDSAGSNESEAKHLNMFCRNASRGKTHRPLSLGARQYVAEFALVPEGEPLPISTYPLEPEQVDLGWMLHDIDFAKGRIMRFFRAKIVKGVIVVPAYDSLDLAA